MNNQVTRCKQCGKVIVGNAKLGLCDSCFSKDSGRAAEGAGILALVWVGVKKYGPKVLKLIKNIKA